MTKKMASALVEELSAEIAKKTGCDQNSGRAFLVAAIKANQERLVRGACPNGQWDKPRVGNDGSVILDSSELNRQQAA